MIEIFKKIAKWQVFRNSEAFAGKTLGFVPTMGALHEGHLSLMQKSIAENDFTLVSLFVNPTQFNDPKDLEKYPRDFDDDFEKLKNAGVDFILFPEYNDIYADGYRYVVSEKKLANMLCGASRPGHFDGVLTVVLKLLQIAGAQKAYFGEKDFQQYMLVSDMAKSFFINTEIIGCPIIRAEDGLALSSRNLLLNKENRKKAGIFPRLLHSGESIEVIKEKLTKEGFKLDYIEEHFGRIFGAVYLQKVRLIDNGKR
ncbi:MAG: pantoate--beta-alanine ligase [Pseudomonadota bacterium]